MSKTLYVTGTMYEANTIELLDDELNRLLEALEKDEEESFWEDLEDIQERLMDDSEINGFWVANGKPYFEAYLDDDLIPFSSLGVDYETTKNIQGKKKDLTNAILVFEKWSEKGSSSCNIEGEFNQEELGLSPESFILPTGEIRYVVSPCYEGEYFDFDESWTDRERTYIVTTKGEIIDL